MENIMYYIFNNGPYNEPELALEVIQRYIEDHGPTLDELMAEISSYNPQISNNRPAVISSDQFNDLLTRERGVSGGYFRSDETKLRTTDHLTVFLSSNWDRDNIDCILNMASNNGYHVLVRSEYMHEIHDNIFDFLFRYRENNPEFLFITRRNRSVRMSRGYWFLGNDDTYLVVSFFGGNDRFNQTRNISFFINRDRHTGQISSGVELVNRRGNDDWEIKQQVLDEICSEAGGFIEHCDLYENSNQTEKWHKVYDGIDYIENLSRFITTDKPIIDRIISESGTTLFDLDINSASEQILRIQEKREKRLIFYNLYSNFSKDLLDEISGSGLTYRAWIQNFKEQSQHLQSFENRNVIDDDVVRYLWQTQHNGISRIAPSFLFEDEYENLKDELVPLTLEVLKHPTPEKWNDVYHWADQQRAAGLFPRGIRRSVINRVFAGCNPHDYSTLLNIVRLRDLVRALNNEFDLNINEDDNWAAMNKNMMDAIRNTIDPAEQEDVFYVNTFVWYLHRHPTLPPPPPPPPPPPGYLIDTIIDDGSFHERNRLESIIERLRQKKNLILQGPPGTGKSWLAKRLGWVLIGVRDSSNLRALQFHPNLSYEDFIRGFRPSADGRLELIDGPFLQMVRDAGDDPDNTYVIVIEEINRGNPAQIFGEMLTLLETDKRTPNEALELSYSRTDGERIHIPKNLHVIGTMNIADRSLALVDLALRRRFAFIDLEPVLNEKWKKWCDDQDLETALIEQIRTRITQLNQIIEDDPSLGKQFQVGHSYVTPTSRIEDGGRWFRQVVETEIRPLLEEYWFDNPSTAREMTEQLLQEL
jgi:5-methylcytosine-specific restriction protein B